MPIRWRLTLQFALILLIILIASSAVLQLLLQRYLVNEVDDILRVNSARVHGTLNPQQVPEPLDDETIHSRLPPINEFASPGIYIQLIGTDGQVVVKSDSLGGQELPVSPALIEQGFAGKALIQTVAAGDGASVRLMVSPLYLRDRTLVLEVAQSLKHVETTLVQFRWALIAFILIPLVLAAASGSFIVRSALSPVSRITRTAKSIDTSSDLSSRVGYQGPADEIGQLAATFDHMIERLDKTFQLQKDFIADASHELRSPLTVMRGNLDLLKRNLGEKDREESLRAIEAETRRMSEVVNDLLFLAEIESDNLMKSETVLLKDVVLEELERFAPLAKGRLVTGHMEDLSVKGDLQHLRRMLGNLIDNAIKYTPDGGSITLTLDRQNGWAKLTVSDTGIGIAPEHLTHIFDRFYRVDKAKSRARGGTGLGLSIVKSIAEQHGGRVTVTSEPSKGSTFTVWLKL